MINNIKFICRKYNLQPKIWKGQNFLIDKKVIDEMIAVADLKKDDVVLEVGPGLGVLTEELAKKVKKVIAIEIDRNIVRALKDILRDYKNIEIMEGDILRLNYEMNNLESGMSFLRCGLVAAPAKKTSPTPLSNYKIVANLPYSITAPFLRKFLEGGSGPKEMLLLIQKEVADRITAEPGEMSLLSVAVQFYCQPRIISYVSKKSFYPQPKVDGAIIKIERRRAALKRGAAEETFFKLFKIGFSSRRKQLRKNLSAGLKMEDNKIRQIFEELNFDFNMRAQELNVEDWIKLNEKLNY